MEKKRKKKSKEQSVWYQRKITLLYLIILVVVIMVLVMAVRSVISYVENNTSFSSSGEDNEKYGNKHNASRFFFRVYYPDHWQVNAHSNGFWLNEEQHLVLELFPMVKVVHTPGPTATPTPAVGDSTPDRFAGMIRDESVTASFYYYDYTEAQKQWIQEHPFQAPEVSQDLTEVVNRTDLQLLDKIAQEVYTNMTGSFDKAVYTWDAQMTNLETTDITLKTYTYQYTKDGVSHKADVYVAVRSSNYYVIVYDGVCDETDNAYGTHRKTFLSILEEFRFSVFEE